jgi:hypothetical protein
LTQDEIRAWMDANFESIMRELGLGWWRVEVVYEILDGPCEMATHDEYERSYLRIDPAQNRDKTEAEFKEMIEHELLHITQGPYNSVHELLGKMLTDKQEVLIDEAFRQAKERNIRHLERLVRQVREHNAPK